MRKDGQNYVFLSFALTGWLKERAQGKTILTFIRCVHSTPFAHNVCLANKHSPLPGSVVWAVSCCCPAPPGEAVLAEPCHRACLRPGVLCLHGGVSCVHPLLWEAGARPQGWGGMGTDPSSDGFTAQEQAPIWVFNRIDHLWPCHL